MGRISSNLAFRIALIGTISFWGMYAILDRSIVIEITSGLLLGGYMILALTWAPSALISVRYGAREGAGLLALGVFSWAMFSAIHRLWIMQYRFAGRPESMLDHWSNPLSIYMIFWGIMIMLLAPGTVSGAVPARNQLYVMVSAAIGALIAGIAIGLSLSRVI